MENKKKKNYVVPQIKCMHIDEEVTLLSASKPHGPEVRFHVDYKGKDYNHFYVRDFNNEEDGCTGEEEEFDTNWY